MRFMDNLTPEKRSENMRRIRSKDMIPEMIVRRLIHRLGYRCRLHGRELPGKPDLVFVSRRKVIFVHGCFWHQHASSRCRIARIPKSNKKYWTEKLSRNVQRDRRNQRILRKEGWRVLIIWECELNKEEKIIRKIENFLNRSK